MTKYFKIICLSLSFLWAFHLYGQETLPEAVPQAAPVDEINQFGDVGDELGMPSGAPGAISLFLRADFVVQAVMLMLLAASMWSWTIIIEKSIKIRRVRRITKEFEELFWSGRSMEDIYLSLKGKAAACPMQAIFISAMREWHHSVQKGSGLLSTAMSDRIDRGMQNILNKELNTLEKYLTFLASVGSAAPFVGLFGTVWGIMNSFASIAASKNTSLAVVAPGISEALLATALGLVAAIPATIFYNKISSDLNRYAAKLDSFTNEMSAIFSRQLDEQEA